MSADTEPHVWQPAPRYWEWSTVEPDSHGIDRFSGGGIATTEAEARHAGRLYLNRHTPEGHAAWTAYRNSTYS